MMVELSNKN